MEAMLQGEGTEIQGELRILIFVHIDRGSFGASLILIFCLRFKYYLFVLC